MLRITKTLGALLCTISTVSLASDFYVGLGGGPEWGDIRDKRTVLAPSSSPSGALHIKNKSHDALRGGFGTVFAGYGYEFGNLWSEDLEPYLGLEINFNLSTVKIENYNKELVHEHYSSTEQQIQHSYGASLLPGVLICDHTLIYARAGYANGKYKLNTSDVSLHNVNKNLSGFRYGAGLQQDLLEDFSVRVEWSTIAYKTVGTFTRDPVSDVTVQNEFSPQTSQVEFAVVYSF